MTGGFWRAVITTNHDQGKLVFGLDIGTRSIVGTVGYKESDEFIVVAQRIKEHNSRAMLDGQIHDIHKVGETIAYVKKQLEEAVEKELKEVCIAAAGRVLRTITTHVEQEFDAEKTIQEEDVYALISEGIEHAYSEFNVTKEPGTKFYCVGYSVVRYLMNGYPMGNLLEHKAKSIGADIIATFLPDDVVDGLYKAVELAGLTVVNLTLEPIAAIQVAIPERYRMLNMALVDVGAGTSDISITKDGSIIAYGMIPLAGDSMTDLLLQHCLTDFEEAEAIKRDAVTKDVIEYTDIMGLTQTITREEVLQAVKPAVTTMTKQISDCIKELNCGKSVSAVFVVGGGGKIPGYEEALAEELGIQKERVALRGEEVMQKIKFMEKNVKKDSLLVTPVGICLSFYEQSNNFIFVTFNEKRVKLYDNTHLTVVDAAIQADFPNDGLFPKRGKELRYTVEGKVRMVRGLPGEASVITVNGQDADIHTPIHSNDIIKVKESTTGEDGKMELGQIPEFKDYICINVNEKKILLPKFASVNGNLQSAYYDIQHMDEIQFLNYYTVAQVAEFMDIIVNKDLNLYVNNKRATLDTPVYENFSVMLTVEEQPLSDVERDREQEQEERQYPGDEWGDEMLEEILAENSEEEAKEHIEESANEVEEPAKENNDLQITVIVNEAPVVLTGKSSYVFVDVFEYIDFDLSTPQGSGVVTKTNGNNAQYMEQIHDGDKIEIYWRT